MPYICVNLKQTISEDEKLKIMKGFGKTIQLIPGKTEDGLMVQINDGCNLFFRGHEMDKIAFVDVSAFKKAEHQYNTLFVEKSNEMLNEILDIPVDNIYLNIVEQDNWGVGGTFR